MKSTLLIPLFFISLLSHIAFGDELDCLTELSELPWNADDRFSPSFTPGGFPKDLNFAGAGFTSVREIFFSHLDQEKQYYLPGEGIFTIEKAENFLESHELISLHISITEPNGEATNKMRAYPLDKKIWHVDPSVIVYADALNIHSKRLFLKSFFRFGWYGFYKVYESLREDEKKHFAPLNMFADIFGHRDVEVINRLVRTFLGARPTAENRESMLDSMLKVKKLFLDLESSLGLDFVKIGIQRSNRSQPYQSWPFEQLGHVRNKFIKPQRVILLPKEITFVREYIDSKGVAPLGGIEYTSRNKNLYEDSVEDALGKIQEWQYNDIAFDLVFNDTNQTGNFSKKYKDMQANMLSVGHEGEIVTQENSSHSDLIPGKIYLLFFSSQVKEEFVSNALIEAYKAGAKKVIPVILDRQ